MKRSTLKRSSKPGRRASKRDAIERAATRFDWRLSPSLGDASAAENDARSTGFACMKYSAVRFEFER